MSIELLFFGQLTDKTGCSSVRIENPGTVGQLKKIVFEKFPALMQSKFTIALNNKIVTEEAIITEPAVVALMPPFSGG